ncbi:MAG: hypothetical protein ACREV9_04845 [Burkholderiales bacterium]
MEIAAKIREIGFKRWYERQLIESHAYLVTCFLSMIAVAVTLEVDSLMRLGFETLVRLGVAFGGIALCIGTWKQYSKRMLLADILGESATCGNCKRYASFNVIGSGTHLPADEGHKFWMRVKCRKCNHEWTMGEY